MSVLKRILHVEDDFDIQEITKLALETFGNFELCQCSNGQDALDQVHGFDPDLFLLDEMMPGMSGSEVLIKLRLIPQFSSTPAVFMTAKPISDSQPLGLNPSGHGFIAKPFNPISLADQITEIWQAIVR